ncbi:MAG: hypothetical protein KDI17_10050 [Halioglobus sp.]|nr:hypothetical protein [Halioglobus sp.]
MRLPFIRFVYLTLLVLPVIACSNGSNNNDSKQPVTSAPEPVAPDEQSVYAVANGCFAISPDGGARFLSVTEAVAADEGSADAVVGSFGLGADSAAEGARFLLRPSDLGKYLLYDQNHGYLVSDGNSLQRQVALAFDVRAVDDKVVVDADMQSEGEWQLWAAPDAQFLLQHVQSGNYIGAEGALVAAADAAELQFVAQDACATFPELTLNATGEVTVTEFDDGSVFGFVETHAHLFTNLAFGGGGVFHGAPFHPLGVEHALHDCDLSHGFEGRRDLMGAGFSGGDINALLPALISGELAEKNHNTDGYPTFTDWPNAPSSSTHQVQYYKWLERAYLSGMRLLVQHATTNEFLCKLAVGVGAQPKRHDCNDMVNVDAILDATFAMERYIDALSGGPGQGWFRIVYSPEEAREEIVAGNLAVVLGIETSVLFDCYLVPPEGFSKCTEADVVAKLDEYHAKGVRVLFPVHKYDNGFSAGDGHRGIIDIGNFGHTGHFNNYIECPSELLTFPGGFDTGGLAFSALNQPRDVYDAAPPVDVSEFEQKVVGTLFPYVALISSGPLAGEYCQKHGLTDLGEFLMTEMMKRGMIIEVDHMPRKSYQRAYEILEEYDYPAMGTHGRNNNGRLYKLGGMSKFNFGRCRSATASATMDDGFQERIQLMRDMGTFPAEGFGFDFNGFAGAPGPRFGDNARCSSLQTDEGVTYPFKSYAGDVTLEQPVVGNRTLDFNTEGMVHLGLVAELIEDVRRDGVSDQELEPLFKSAEGYIRVWEKSERRALDITKR